MVGGAEFCFIPTTGEPRPRNVGLVEAVANRIVSLQREPLFHLRATDRQSLRSGISTGGATEWPDRVNCPAIARTQIGDGIREWKSRQRRVSSQGVIGESRAKMVSRTGSTGPPLTGRCIRIFWGLCGRGNGQPNWSASSNQPLMVQKRTTKRRVKTVVSKDKLFG